MKSKFFTLGFSLCTAMFLFSCFVNAQNFGKKDARYPAIEITVEKITAACAGSNSGAVSISVTGGKGEYSYNWTGPDGFSKKSKNINNLAPGIYNLVVKDAKGNTSYLQVEVTILPALLVIADITDVSCFHSSTGAIHLSVSGGSGSGYVYRWTGINGFKANTKDISNLKAGTYNITITDDGGCSMNLSFPVAQPASELTSSVSKTESNVCRGNGTITAIGAGGTAPYFYKLNNGTNQSSGFFNNLNAGIYSITILDSKGCEITSTVTILDQTVDLYEDNNELNKAKEISLYFPVEARIAPSANDIDWYKFMTEPTSSTYSLRVYSPVVDYTFNIYDGAGNLVSGISIDSKSKVYHSLAVNTTYYIKVSGTVSNSCYNLQIEPPIEGFLLTRQVNNFSEIQNQTAKIFPNPHNGSFTLNIESPLDGIATIEIYNANGQKLNTQKQPAIKGKNIIATYQNMKGAILFYRIMIGNKQFTGKIIGTN